MQKNALCDKTSDILTANVSTSTKKSTCVAITNATIAKAKTINSYNLNEPIFLHKLGFVKIFANINYPTICNAPYFRIIVRTVLSEKRTSTRAPSFVP